MKHSPVALYLPKAVKYSAFPPIMSVYPGYANSSPIPAVYNPVANDARVANRTPSPTPSELEALKQTGFFNYQSIFRKDKLLTKKYLSPSQALSPMVTY